MANSYHSVWMTDGIDKRKNHVPSPDHDKYRNFTSDISKIRELLNVGCKIPMTIRHPCLGGRDSYPVVATVTEKYPYHFMVEFKAPSGITAHRSVQYLSILMGETKIPKD